MCGQDCRTFLWGGTGTSTVGADGGCRCACGDETWSEHNMLGLPSCVPSKAHVVFGAVGVLMAMTSLCHSAYHLRRQVKHHRLLIVASTSSVEKCRRWLHIVVITLAVLDLCYFGMVLLLDSKRLWMSAIVMFGAGQIMMTIAGVLTVRMWIYCNDPRLIRETPEILAISGALERPTGCFVSNTVMCVGPAIAAVLAAVQYLQAASRVSSVAFLGLIVFCDFIILKSGTALVRTVNRSLLNSAAGTVASLQLLKARKNVKFALCFCVIVSLLTALFLMIGLFTTYGTTAPLIFFGIPHGVSPHVWFIFNVQLHAGRSRSYTASRVLSGASSQSRQVSSVGSRISSKVKAAVLSSERAVVPTETPASPCFID
ncbi:unnamed protein product [Ectocarpus fasciculatus]